MQNRYTTTTLANMFHSLSVDTQIAFLENHQQEIQSFTDPASVCEFLTRIITPIKEENHAEQVTKTLIKIMEPQLAVISDFYVLDALIDNLKSDHMNCARLLHAAMPRATTNGEQMMQLASKLWTGVSNEQIAKLEATWNEISKGDVGRRFSKRALISTARALRQDEIKPFLTKHREDAFAIADEAGIYDLMANLVRIFMSHAPEFPSRKLEFFPPKSFFSPKSDRYNAELCLTTPWRREVKAYAYESIEFLLDLFKPRLLTFNNFDAFFNFMLQIDKYETDFSKDNHRYDYRIDLHSQFIDALRFVMHDGKDLMRVCDIFQNDKQPMVLDQDAFWKAGERRGMTI
jgi:hypothetical protein